MSDEIMITFGEDGVAREYDDTWDIIIHCESQEEQDEVWAKLKKKEWIPCKERKPEEEGRYLVACGLFGEHVCFADWNGKYWGVKTPVRAWMPGIKEFEMREDERREIEVKMNVTVDLRALIKAGLIEKGDSDA